MKSILRQRRKSSVLSAVACIIVGVVLVAFPQDSVRWMCMVLGAVLTVAGVWNLVSFFRGRSVLSVFQIDLLLGIVLTIFGVWLLLWPDSVIALLQYVFGIFILLHGVVELQAAIELHGGFVPVLLGLLPLLFGVLIIFNPFETMSALIILIGAVLIYNGAVELYLIIRLSRVAAAAAAAVEDSVEREQAKAEAFDAEFTEQK